MKANTRRVDSPNRASGLIEVLIVLATLALLVVILLPRLSTVPRPRAARISCVNNLRSVGLAARLWSNDHGDVYPWNAPMSTNGVKELATSGNVAALFRSMSNELNNPKTLNCPSDTRRKRESDFSKLSNKNISYFVGLDADETKPQTILSGDRNISGGLFVSNRVMEVRITNVLVWGADIHIHAGNIGLGDGSVCQANNVGLQKQVTAHHLSFTNGGMAVPAARFALP